MMRNPDKISFSNEGVQEEKCGCVGSYELTECAYAVEAQVCEEETCSLGEKWCRNRF
uniref:Metallothionein n=1 Tax=Peronospora matthiolae TaxID=2874970 RepID=A0AAV1UU21_9STRA